jgi:Major Facilitator Superfamily
MSKARNLADFESINHGARLTPLHWLVCAVAGLGFAFDLYETLMLPLILRPALADLGGLGRGTPQFNLWAGLLFFIPSAAGGIFALFGGYLMDLVGRRRVLIWSILLYGFSACAAAYCTSLSGLLVLRCTTMIGVCVEYAASVAWVAELFPDPKQREAALGYTQAFFPLGGLLVTGAYFLAVTFADQLPTIRAGHEAWRYTLLSGLIPALPLLIVRPFLPESPIWRERKSRGLLKRPSIVELFRPTLRMTTLVTTFLIACSFALPFGAIQQTVLMIHDLPDIRNLAPRQIEHAVSAVQFFQELGGIAGRLIFAILITRIVTQRRLMRTYLGAGLVVFSWLYFFGVRQNLLQVELGIFLATLLFNGLHSFWGNYLPRVYPTHLRGTGESFSMNVGGRAIGVSAALLTTQLANVMPAAGAGARLAYSAGIVAGLACVVGLLGSFWLPEPIGNRLPD